MQEWAGEGRRSQTSTQSGSDGVGTKRDTVMDDSIQKQLAELIECYRARCLWFLAEDFVPETPETGRARARVH